MRILYVVTLASATSRYGGPFDVIRAQAALVESAGNSIELVAGWTDGDRAPDAPAGRSSHRRVRPWLPTRDFTGLLSAGMLQQLWVSVGRADIVHVSFAREAIPIAAVVIALIRRRPVVAQPHGMLTSRHSLMHAAVDQALRPLMRRVDHWLALTAVEQRDLWNRYGRTLRAVTTIGNPVSVDHSEALRLRVESPDRSAVFIARLHPRKRVLDFAAAAAVAQARGWDDRYRVFGPDQGDLLALREQTARSTNLSYDGPLDSDRIPAFLASAGAFVLTSSAEPWGNVLATAVTLGVPTVLTRSSALAELLKGAPGVHIVEDGDAAGIAEAVHAALSEGHVAPSTIFDRATLLRRLEGVFDRVLQRRAEQLESSKRAPRGPRSRRQGPPR